MRCDGLRGDLQVGERGDHGADGARRVADCADVDGVAGLEEVEDLEGAVDVEGLPAGEDELWGVGLLGFSG